MSELLPCPFCGATPKRVNNGMIYGTWPVACAQDGCPVRGLVIQISQWETRSGSQGVVDDAMVERAKDAYDQEAGYMGYASRSGMRAALAAMGGRAPHGTVSDAMVERFRDTLMVLHDGPPNTQVSVTETSVREAIDGLLVALGLPPPPTTISEERAR